MNETANNNGRGIWGSRFAFVLAAAGSAVGLGNIWGFPTAAAQNGGGGFVLIYILCILLVGLPVMLAEMVIGRAGEKNPVGALKHLKKGTPWYFVGVLGVVTGFVILSFYTVIAGWTVYYFIQAVGGALTVPEGRDSAEYFSEMFGAMTANPGYEILFVAIFMLATISIVAAGVQKGIERSVKIMMPLLFVLLIFLIGRATTLEGAAEGLGFYLVPKLDQINLHVIVFALGQAFFSLSLGMGVMITYGSYLRKEECLPSSAGYVVTTDTLIAIFAGLIVFPVVFFMAAIHGSDPEVLIDTSGPGLVFVVFPQILSEIPGGAAATVIFGGAFFLLLAIAALTSAISLLEVVTAHFIDDWKIERKKAAWCLGGIIFLLAIPSALSMGAVGWLSEGGVFGLSFFDLLYTLTFQFFLPLGALGLALFVGWAWGLKKASAEIQTGTPNFRLEKVWHVMIRYVAPLAIVIIMAAQIVEVFGGDAEEEDGGEAPAETAPADPEQD